VLSAPWPGKLDHFRVGRLERLGGDVLLDPGLGVGAAKKLGDLTDGQEFVADPTPRDGGVLIGEPRIDVGLKEQ